MKVPIFLISILWIALVGVDCYGQASTDASMPHSQVYSDPTAVQVLSVPIQTEPAEVNALNKLMLLRNELEHVLSGLNVVTAAGRKWVAQRLEVLAGRSIKLAEDLSDSAQQVEAESCLLQARYAQAEQARCLEQADAASVRVGQLRSGAWRIKQYGARGVDRADSIGDFWLLQADLFDINRSRLDLDQRQFSAARRIESFLRDRAVVVGGKKTAADETHMLQQVRFALLQLYDQWGRSGEVSDLLRRMRQSAYTDGDLTVELNRWFGYVDRIGEPFDVDLTSADGQTWSSVDHLGKVIVLSFWAHGAFEAGAGPVLLHRLAADLCLDRQELVHVPIWVGSKDGTNRLFGLGGHIFYRDKNNGVHLSHRFAVRSVPRFVLVDQEGRIAAAGGEAIGDVLDQLIAAGKKEVVDEGGFEKVEKRKREEQGVSSGNRTVGKMGPSENLPSRGDAKSE